MSFLICRDRDTPGGRACGLGRARAWRVIWSETSALELLCPILDTTRIRSRGLGSGGAAESITMQRGLVYIQVGNAEMLSLCKEGLSIYKWVMQRCYHYAKRAYLYTKG